MAGRLNVCAVIVAAHGTPRWVLDTLQSIERQDPKPGWRYELRLGVDGCENTRTILDRREIPYYWSRKNVGAYVMRNSLIGLQEANAYAIFDSDDLMFPRYLSTLLGFVDGGMIAGAARLNTRVDLMPVNAAAYRAGVCIVPHLRWTQLGGYREERIGSDVDLIDRAKALGIEIHRHPEVLYLRRKRAGSLTQARATSIRSPYRANMRKKQTQAVRRGFRRVKSPTTTTLERING